MVTWFYFISFIASLVMIAVFLRRNARIDTVYAVFSVLVALNSMGRWLIATSQTVEQAIWANKIMYVGACFAPLLLVMVLAKLCGLGIPKVLTAVLTAFSSIVLASVMTIGYNGLYYKNCSLAQGDGYSYLVKEYGPLHILYTILMITDMLLILMLIIYAIKNRNTIPSKTVGTIGGLCIMILLAYMMSRLLHSSIEWHFIGYLIAVIVIAQRFEHINMYDMSANIANSVERMKEYGFIVFDNKGRFINANDLIKGVFPEIAEWKTEKQIKKSDSLFYREVIEWYEQQRGGEDKSAVKNVKINELYLKLSIKDVIYGSKKVGELMEIVDKTSEHNYLAEIEKAKREAVEANQAKSSFLAQMSHEIRTPINAVLGMNEMILRETSEDNIREYAGNAYNAGKSLLSIINDILDISKIEAGKLEITDAEYELYSLINDCYNMLVDRAEKKGLAFSVSCGNDLPSGLIGDMFHIRQIIVNLLTNAIKYTDKGSVSLDVSGTNDGDDIRLVIRVSDTGIGLTEENLEKLFTNFQRFDIERNRTVEGTGLGLSICRQLAELMGGNVRAESVYGEGSSFICEIPQKIADPAPIGELRFDRAAKVICPGERKAFCAPDARILVVDDVEMNLVVFKSLLKSHEMKIDTALSGNECLALAAENKYDIIFMDHMMPDPDGIKTFEMLKEKQLISDDTPVIMLTANAISGEEEKYLDAGFASYLTKPIQSGKLDEALLGYLPEDKVRFTGKTVSVKAASSHAAGTEEQKLIDVSVGLSYSSGNADVYLETLQSFVKGGAEMLSDIRGYYENKDHKNYIIKVHALKGMALNIGAKQLSEAARELESAGKSGNYEIIGSRTEVLLLLYEEVLDEGRKYLDEHMPDTAAAEDACPDELTEISTEQLSELIDVIKAACLGFDGDRAAALCDEAGKYSCSGIALKPLLSEVKALTDDFDYDKAAEKAEAIMSKFSL